MKSTFLAMVLLPEPLTLNVDQVTSVLGEYPGAADAVLNRHDVQRGRFAVTLGGQSFAVQCMEEPVPAQDFQKELAGVGREVLAPLVESHHAHLIVFCTLDDPSMGDAVMAAAGVHSLAARLGSFGAPLAGFWVASERLCPWPEFQDDGQAVAAAYTTEGAVEFPTRFWVAAHIQPGAGVMGGLTKGLKPFTGYEVELARVPWEAEPVAQRLIGTVQYLFLNGDILENEQTLGATKDERFQVIRPEGSARLRLDLLDQP